MSNRKDTSEMTDEELADARKIVFYCKDCGELVETKKMGKKYVYICKVCNTKNVAFGTKRSIFGFYNLDEKKLEKIKEEKVKRAEEKKSDRNRKKK